MTNAVLCVDIGTTSLKAGLITALGEVVSFCSLPFEDSQNEFAASSWLGVFVKAVAELESQCLQNNKSVTVCGIALSGNGPTVVADCAYTVFWNEDTSDIRLPDFDEAKKSLFIPKLLTLKNHAPSLYKKAGLIFSGPEYLLYILTGKAVTILPEERFKPAYWSDEVCSACGIDAKKLPPFTGVGSDCGPVCEQVMTDLKQAVTSQHDSSPSKIVFSPDCRVFTGGPDFVVALIGTATLKAGALCDRCGSSEGLNFCTAKPVAAPGLRTLPSVIPGLWNVSYLIPESGSMSDEKRLAELERGINVLKAAAAENGIDFPEQMSVTGGQTNDELLLREKAERLGMKILRPAGGHFVHSELIGDACAAWFGLGVYNSLQDAADKIVKLEPYENI